MSTFPYTGPADHAALGGSGYTSPDGPILIVDDDEAIRLLFLRALQRAGMPCLTAADGEEALMMIENGDVGLVLLDSTMPGLGGQDVIARVRARPTTRTLPIILVTGRAEVSERVAGLEAGADDYLTKPVHLDELVARVRALQRGRAAWASVLADELRQRAETAASLTRLRTEGTPERTALGICQELVRLRALPLVAILSRTPEGGAIPLAVNGPPGMPWRTGLPLHRSYGTALIERAEHGAWVAVNRSGEPGGLAEPHLEQLGIRATIQAPLRSRGHLLGLLVLGIAGNGSGSLFDDANRELPAAIDFAAIASALLAPALDSRLESMDARARLAAIIATRAFAPVFQPIVELNGGRVVGYEALTRFEDGEAPEVRFAEATRLGMGIALETACLRAALAAAPALPDDAWLSLNVSPSLVLEGEILRGLVEQSDRTIMVELTEHDPVEDYGRLRAALDKLGDRARVSVDDAGSGYASLQHILALRPAFVKLDSTWVSGLEDDPARQALVAGLSHFASSTGCQLIAEGIETTAERTALGDLAVRLGQGFLLGRPQPVAA